MFYKGVHLCDIVSVIGCLLFIALLDYKSKTNSRECNPQSVQPWIVSEQSHRPIVCSDSKITVIAKEIQMMLSINAQGLRIMNGEFRCLTQTKVYDIIAITKAFIDTSNNYNLTTEYTIVDFTVCTKDS